MLLSEIQRAELDPPTKSFAGDSLLTLMLVDAAKSFVIRERETAADQMRLERLVTSS